MLIGMKQMHTAAGRNAGNQPKLNGEMAASSDPTDLDQSKRVFPWGSEAPDFSRANTDWRAMGCIDASAFPDGDSAFGCRQMIGNVWGMDH